MADCDEGQDLKEFLRRVDEIESVVKGFNCDDEQIQKASLVKADKLLKQVEEPDKFKYDRTVINKSTPQSCNQVPERVTTDPDAFMQALEADAAERTCQRKEKAKVATVWKERGNAEFKAGNYDKAIVHYTEGMTHLKDMVVLYTNRAQAYNRLGEYDSALKDCDAAIFLDAKSVKAYIHQGKAYEGQSKYEEAIKSYKEILKFDSKKKTIVNVYVSSANQARRASEAESQATRVFQSGDVKATSAVQILERLCVEGKPVIYYDGGMKILGTLIKDDTSRTLFRTHGGFKLFTDNATIKGCFKRVLIPGCADDTLDLVCTCLDVLQNVIRDNDENNKCLVQIDGFANEILLSLSETAPTGVQFRCVQLMLQMSQNPVGRAIAVLHFDNIRLLVGLMTFVQNSKTGAEDAAKILNNLALEKRFVCHFKDRVAEQVLPAFENLMQNSDKIHAPVVSSCLSFMGNMAHDTTIRRKMCSRYEFWEASLAVMMRYGRNLTQTSNQDIVHALLGLLINISLETPDTIKSIAPEICEKTTSLLDCQDNDLKGRATGLLSRVVPHLQDKAMAELCDNMRLPRHLIEILQSTSDDVTKRYASKTLTVLTQSQDAARQEVVESDEGLRMLCNLLSTDDDIVVANVALCIGHCTEVPDMSGDLVGSGIVKTLLAKTHTVNGTIKQNCAITLAKLASSDKRHLKEVQDLGGIGILNSCMKYVK